MCMSFLVFLKVDELREAIEELFYFEFVLDDIPIWGFVGYLEESGFLPHSHKVPLLRLHVNCSDKRKRETHLRLCSIYLNSRFLFQWNRRHCHCRLALSSLSTCLLFILLRSDRWDSGLTWTSTSSIMATR